MAKQVKLSQLRQIVGTLSPIGPLAALKAFAGDFVVVVPEDVPNAASELLEACETLGIQVSYGTHNAESAMLQTVYDELNTVLDTKPSWGKLQVKEVLRNVFGDLPVKL